MRRKSKKVGISEPYAAIKSHILHGRLELAKRTFRHITDPAEAMVTWKKCISDPAIKEDLKNMSADASFNNHIRNLFLSPNNKKYLKVVFKS